MAFTDRLEAVYDRLREARLSSSAEIERVLERAVVGSGLPLEDVPLLLAAPADWDGAIFDAAAQVNQRIKGKTITFYGVTYIHDFCINQCSYCGDSIHADYRQRRILSSVEFLKDVSTLLQRHPLKEICFLMGEAPTKFDLAALIRYLREVTRIYHEKIILNIPPMSVEEFAQIRAAIPNRLHFRVFQETYDPGVYAREHRHGPKTDFLGRIDAQCRALQAGFDEAGHGVLYGLNDRRQGALYDTFAMLAHAHDLRSQFGRWSQSMSFPRLQPAPGIDFPVPSLVDDRTLTRCIATVKLTTPQVDTVVTCRERAEFRRQIRPIVNIEDFAARPGPGGNMDPTVHQQMFLPDMRSGEDVRAEMIRDGYGVR